MGHVFISYSRDDRAYVRRLAAHLTGAGLAVWWDDDLAAGDNFGTVIQSAIDTCDAFVPALTPSAVASRWVVREIAHADRVQKPVLPLLLADCVPPIAVAGVHHEDVTSGDMPSTRFVDRLRALVDEQRPVQAPRILIDESEWMALRRAARTARRSD